MNHKPFTTTELKPLPDAVQELIAERDEWKARCEFSFEQRDKLNAQLKTLQYEVDAIPEIKAERDAYEKCADTMAAAHKVERDALKAENEKLHALRHEREDVISDLKDAARLALDALLPFRGDRLIMVNQAIAALQEAL